MALQLEDCVDVLKVLYPQFDFLFLFDHSCWHDHQKEDGWDLTFQKIDDTGPFWMTEAERDQKRHDLVLEGQTITRQYTKDELLKKQLKRLKQMLSKDGKINQRVCCRYFGSVDLLMN